MHFQSLSNPVVALQKPSENETEATAKTSMRIRAVHEVRCVAPEKFTPSPPEFGLVIFTSQPAVIGGKIFTGAKQ